MALKTVVLVGGVGGAKLVHGLAQVIEPENLTVIVNTGDDFWQHGLRICPDMDTVMYTLADWVNKANGWGVADDSFTTLETLKRYGADTWFGLGNKDIATHLLRTQWWHEGVPLTEITRRLTTALDIRCRVLPMTDTPVATMVNTVEQGELEFQQYFVRERWQPVVRSLRLAGIEQAVLTTEVRDALLQADLILIGPSNPWLSIAPILAVPGLSALLQSLPIPRVAVTPIIQGRAVKGPAAKIMQELGYDVSPQAVASFYGDVINGFVYDERDHDLLIEQPRRLVVNTLMQDDHDRAQLARTIMTWIKEWEDYVHVGNYSG